MKELIQRIFALEPSLPSQCKGASEPQLTQLASYWGRALPVPYVEFLKHFGNDYSALNLPLQVGIAEVMPVFHSYLQKKKAGKVAHTAPVQPPYFLIGINLKGNDAGHSFLNVEGGPLFPVSEITDTYGVRQTHASLMEFFFGKRFPRETRKRVAELSQGDGHFCKP